MATREVIVLNEDTPQLEAPQTGDVAVLPITLQAATGNEAALSLNYTTNKAAGDDTGLLVNMTDTASPGTSLLADFQVGGSSKFKIANSGAPTFNSSAFYNTGTRYDIHVSGSTFVARLANNQLNLIGIPLTLDSKAWLYGDAANTLAQRNSTNAQTFNIYNTYSDASNYERLSISGTTIAAENAGTGSAQDIVLKMSGTTSGSKIDFHNSGGTSVGFINDYGALNMPTIYPHATSANQKIATVSNKIDIRGLYGAAFYPAGAIASGDVFTFGNWGHNLTASSGVQSFFSVEPAINQSGTAGYTGIHLDVTETATGSGDNYLMDLQVGGTSQFRVDNSGNLFAPNLPTSDPLVAGQIWSNSGVLTLSAG